MNLPLAVLLHCSQETKQGMNFNTLKTVVDNLINYISRRTLNFLP